MSPPEELRLTDDGRALTLTITGGGGRGPGNAEHLATYVYRPRMPAHESPRPYLHPVRTRAGTLVTDVRPADHPWHHGLSLALPHVGDANLWGGPTWVRQEGAYVELPVNGSMRHEAFRDVGASGRRAWVAEQLSWHDAAASVLAHERRELTFGLLPGAWQLRWTSAVTNATTRPLAFGSPATHGRTGAGYAGIFWRAAPSFADAEVVAPSVAGPHSGEDLMGVRAPWMAFTAAAPAASATVVLVADDGRGGPPTWFARSREYPGFGPAPFAARDVTLAPGGSFTLTCRAVVTDGDLATLDRRILAADPGLDP